MAAGSRRSSVLASLVGAVALGAPGLVGQAAEYPGGYVALLESYAQGRHSAAIERLGASTKRDLDVIEDSQEADRRCPACPQLLDTRLLRAAAMLHWDRDRLEHPAMADVEHKRGCPGRHAAIAGRFAARLAERSDGRDFARAFFLAMVESCQWDACFPEAQRWAREALELFPRDAAMLLAKASALEEQATLPANRPRSALATPLSVLEGQLDPVRRGMLQQARLDFAETLAVDAELALAHIRLGRVLWRLGQPKLARARLEEGLARASRPEQRYFAQLFLGRIHEDAQRLDQALQCYRNARDMDPASQTAAIALAHAQRLAGDGEAARDTLARGLREAWRRKARDPYWDYLTANIHDLAGRVDVLHEQARQ